MLLLWKFMANYRMLAACVVRMPKIQHVSFRSWQLFGPGTVTNIDVLAIAWTGYVRRIAANPFQRVTGILLQIRTVYLGCLIEAYADTQLLTELESNRNDQVYYEEGKNIMKGYMAWSKRFYNGDVGICNGATAKENAQSLFW